MDGRNPRPRKPANGLPHSSDPRDRDPYLKRDDRGHYDSEYARSGVRPTRTGGLYHDPPNRGAARGVRQDRERERERDWDRDRLQARSRSRQNGGIRGRMTDDRDALSRLEDMLHYIQNDWDFMTSDSCVPVKAALELMDTSSLGKAYLYGSFKETHMNLQEALQSIVNDHHQGFNSSIGTYHSIMRNITTSQEKVRGLREKLIRAKGDLSASKPEVKNLVVASQKYDEMLRMLNAMEQLQLVPEKLESRISEKRFLTAVQLLSDSLKTIRQPELMEISALVDLRAYLSNQEVSLSDILIEELHNHLYLKSLYCVDRWKPYNPGDNKIETAVDFGVDGDKNATGAPLPEMKPLISFLEFVDFTVPMVEDANSNKNPEADSLSYIRLLLESLNSLGYLSNAISTINQRLPVELFKLVDRTNQEVDQRHPSSFIIAGRTRNPRRSIDLGPGENDARVTVLYDLLWTLYSKFEAVMEGHRVVHDVIKGISKRENWTAEQLSMTNGFTEVWQLVQSEMRSLLHDYLTANESRGANNAPKSMQNANNIVAGKVQREKNKVIFKLNSADFSTTAMKRDQEDLESILKASVPGLVSESLRLVASSAEAQSSSDGAATGHKLLIEPSVFNMGFLLPPSLAFLQRVKEIVPPNSGIALSTLTSFLDDFLVNVFHPALDDTMHDLFTRTTGDIDAFQQDAMWMNITKKPVMKGTASFYNLIIAFCRMLETIPPDHVFGELIIDLLTSYYGKCCDWYKELVSKTRATASDEPSSLSNGESKASATWAASPDMRSAMRAVLNDMSNDETLLNKENVLQTTYESNRPLTPDLLIKDKKIISGLCTLYTSLKWLGSKVVQLRLINNSEESALAGETASTGRRPRHRWTLPPSSSPNHPLGYDELAPPMLPMSKEVVTLFDSVISSYEELTETILFTLRSEARTHVLYYLNKFLAANSFVLDLSPYHSSLERQAETTAVTTNHYQEASPHILSLNTSLISLDSTISTILPFDITKFITHGLASFSCHILISSSLPEVSKLRSINVAGVSKMTFNILILQQNLKNVEHGVSLSKAMNYYLNIFPPLGPVKENKSHGPEGIIQLAASFKNNPTQALYSYNEVRNMLYLYYSEALEWGSDQRGSSGATGTGSNTNTMVGRPRESALQAKRSLNEWVGRLEMLRW